MGKDATTPPHSLALTWASWPLLRLAGFVNVRSDFFLYTWARDEPEIRQLDRWQFLAGDVDSL